MSDLQIMVDGSQMLFNVHKSERTGLQKTTLIFLVSLSDKVHTCVDWLVADLMTVKIIKAQFPSSMR